jgi:hypothetical protein
MSELGTKKKENFEKLTLGKGPPTCTDFKVPAIHYNEMSKSLKVMKVEGRHSLPPRNRCT